MHTIEYFVPGLCVREPQPRERIVSGVPRVRTHLTELVVRLRLAQSAVATCVAALRQQNCELDEDVARLLQRCAADVLGEQIEETEEMLGALADPGN
jgi:hypothetical protein